MNWLFIFCLCALQVACSPSSSGNAVIDIPTVQRVCSTSKCTSVMGNLNATTVFTLSGCSDDTMTYDTIATGRARVTCNGTNCNGLLNSWSDENVQPVTTMTSQRYYICTWIDLNDDNFKNSADEFSELYQMVNSSAVLTINTWGASAFFAL